MNDKTKYYNKIAFPYRLMYKRNDKTGELDIIKAYKNEWGDITHIEIVGRG